MAEIVSIIGLVVLVIGGLMFIYQSFKVGIIWGLACLFIPVVSLIFLLLHWDVAKKPFFIQLAGTVLYFVGIAFGATMTFA